MLISQKYRLTMAMAMATIGFMMLLWFALLGPPTILYPSLIIILLLATSFLLYGVISTPSIILSATFIPALAIFWAYIHDRPYINSRNHWLQDNLLWGETAVYLTMVSFVFTFSFLLTFNKQKVHTFKLCPPSFFLGREAYIAFSLMSLFFFWLAEPSFSTILTSTYIEIMDDRFEHVQYAGGLGMICWLFSLTTYLARHRQKNRTVDDRWPDQLFIIVTVIIILWLSLHSRRNELMGVGISLLLIINYLKGKVLTRIFAISFLSLLLFIGAIRGHSLLNHIEGNPQLQLIKDEQTQLIKSLPSGASNVFATYMTTIHYFDKQPLLLGDTFTNYFYTILPTNLYQKFDVERPEYFYQHVLNKYDYNGGTYIGAIFYGNFGVIGAVVLGLFIGFYILLTSKSLNSSNIIVQIIGFYMIGMVCRGFWYELITIIKPIIMVLLPSYITFAFIHKHVPEYSKKKLTNIIKWH